MPRPGVLKKESPRKSRYWLYRPWITPPVTIRASPVIWNRVEQGKFLLHFKSKELLELFQIKTRNLETIRRMGGS